MNTMTRSTHTRRMICRLIERTSSATTLMESSACESTSAKLQHPPHSRRRGALANFATNATGFSSQFPGINPHLLTLTANFQVPFYRDLLQAMGICSVTKRSCEHVLRKGPGNAITIVVGGAAESLNAHPGTSDLILKKRLGFIKIAVREGCVELFTGCVSIADDATVQISCLFSPL